MKRLITAALLSSAVLAFAQANPKKDLVQKLLVLQQPGIEQVARSLVERPAVQMMQEVAMVLQRQVPPDGGGRHLELGGEFFHGGQAGGHGKVVDLLAPRVCAEHSRSPSRGHGGGSATHASSGPQANP